MSNEDHEECPNCQELKKQLAERDAEIQDAFQRGWQAGNDAQDEQDKVIADLRTEVERLTKERDD